MNWLNTLGGGYSALGDYFEHHVSKVIWLSGYGWCSTEKGTNTIFYIFPIGKCLLEMFTCSWSSANKAEGSYVFISVCMCLSVIKVIWSYEWILLNLLWKITTNVPNLSLIPVQFHTVLCTAGLLWFLLIMVYDLTCWEGLCMNWCSIFQAVKAAEISGVQLRVALEMGDPPTVIRCHLYLALSLMQRGRVREAKYMLRSVCDHCLHRMSPWYDWLGG